MCLGARRSVPLLLVTMAVTTAPYYPSPFTAADRPPSAEALLPGTEYDVADLEHELRRVIVRFRPTLILVPHWADTHPDHCTTYFFVADALRTLEAGLPGFRTELAAYPEHLTPGAELRCCEPPAENPVASRP